MRLEKLQEYLHQKNWKYRYAEESGLGSIDWEYRGITYHVWEFPGAGAESNVQMAGKMKEYYGNYEIEIIRIIEGWG